MTSSTADGSPIVIGYAWRQRVAVTRDVALGAVFPAGCTLTAHVRATRAATTVLATLTLGAGLTRVDDATIEIALTAAQTRAFAAGSVVLDVARTDLVEPAYLGFVLKVPTLLPVTRLA